MRIGIDASNLRQGGGLTHLAGLLGAAELADHGIEKLVLFGPEHLLRRITPDRPEITIVDSPLLLGSLPKRLLWQRACLPKLLRGQCDLLFVPGGSYVGDWQPFVTMCRNMLPFERSEMKRYGLRWNRFRLSLLRRSQARTFRRAAGLIFLTRYAQTEVSAIVTNLPNQIRVIPHGIEERFRLEPRPQSDSERRTLKLLYVSIVSPYKHPWNVAEAAAILRERNWPVQLDLVGPAETAYLPRLARTLSRLDPAGAYLRYHGAEEFSALHRRYQQADVFIFASSCENMPNILLEAMAAGLPIACSGRGPMPEVLGNAGTYFDPEKPSEIAGAVEQLLREPRLRERQAWRAYNRASQFSWGRCARETFSFLSEVVHSYKPVQSPCAA